MGYPVYKNNTHEANDESKDHKYFEYSVVTVFNFTFVGLFVK